MMSLHKSEKGFSVIEAMVAALILSIVGLASAKNSIMAMVSLKRTMRNSIAMQLAVEKLEEYGSVNPTSLDTADNLTEGSVVVDNITFTRATTVTVNSDNSRTVSVIVNAADSSLGGTYSISGTFPLWGNT